MRAPQQGSPPSAGSGGEMLARAPTGVAATDTANLSGDLDAANAAGATLVLRDGLYVSDFITKAYAPRIRATKQTVIQPGGTAAANGAGGWLWTFQGSAGAQNALTANTLAGSKVVAVATAGISPGDLIRLGSSVLLRDESATVQPRYLGQLAEVDTVDSGTQLTLREPVHSDFKTTDGAWLQKITTIDEPTISGRPKFVNTAPTTTTVGFLLVKFARDADIDVRQIAASAAGVQLMHCFRGDVRSRGRESVADGTTTFGYGVLLAGATAHVAVDTTMYHGGAAFNTSGVDNDYGGAYNCTGTGTSIGSKTIGFGTHPGARDITFKAPHVMGAATDGVGMRSDGCRLEGGLIDHCGAAVGMLDDARNIDIIGVRIRDVVGDCIHYQQNSANPAGDLRIRVRGCDASGLPRNFAKFNCNAGTLVGIDVSDNILSNFGTANGAVDTRAALAFYAATDRVTVKRNTLSDSQAAPTGSYLVHFASGTSKGLVEDNELLDGITLTNASSNSTVTFGEQTYGTATAKARAARVVAPSGGTLDCSKSSVFALTLATATTGISLTNPVDGQLVRVMLIQDATGGRSVSWAANVIWRGGQAPFLTSAPNGVDSFTFEYNATLGNWYPVARTVAAPLLLRADADGDTAVTIRRPSAAATGDLLNIQDEVSGALAKVDSTGRLTLTRPAGASAARVAQPGEAQARYQLGGSGDQEWGDGTNARDTFLQRASAGVLRALSTILRANAFQTDGLTGATAGARFVGGTASGAPSSGTFAVGDYVVDQAGGAMWVCTVAGSPGTWVNPAVGGVYPWENQNLKGWTADPYGNASSGVAPVAQVLVVGKIAVPKTITVANVLAEVTGAGSGLTAGAQNVGVLLDSAGNLIDQSADQATAWTTTGTKPMALGATHTITGGPGVFVYAGVLAGGTTLPQLARGNGPANQGASPPRFGRTTTTVTSPPASITPGSLSPTTAFWFGLS
jgi:hypothetical protein